MVKSPLALVKAQFGNKAALVVAVQAFSQNADLWLAQPNHEALAQVSNAKLLKLHATFTAVQRDFGTREKLVDAILVLEGRSRDAGYKSRLMGHPVPRLFDNYKATKKRAAAAKKA